MKKKLFTLLTLLLCLCSGAWGQNTYSNPLTETFTDGAYGNYTFLDVANTTSNATIETGSVACLTYGGFYAWMTLNKDATNKWMTRAGGDNTDSGDHGYSNPDKVGFLPNNEANGQDNIKITSERTTCFYVTGCTGVAILGKDNGTSSNRWMTLKVEEIALDGSATQRGTTKEQKSTSVYLLPSDATMTADKYYRVTVASAGTKNCNFYQIRFTQGASSKYGITWDNGGHGTAPTAPTSTALLTLPTMDKDGDYVNTGWTANVAVKLNGTSKAAGTVLPVGSKVRLTAATTFTGIWKEPSTFALTSNDEVEVTVGGSKSQIAYENAAGTVTYESTNPSVATVDEEGNISAVAGGKTTITVSDPGNATTAAGSATVTVLVPYGNPSAATSYVLNQDTYAFQNKDYTKYYFTNGFTIDVSPNGAEFQDASLSKSKKYSHARTYTINVPSNVTVTYAIITARNNYENKNSNPAANWGTVFGESYSSILLPWANETPAEKDFVIETPSAGGTLVFQPGGNQWQAIINLYTDTYYPKHTVSYVAGDGTGTMAGTEVREGTSFTLPIQGTIAAPAGKYFTGWNDGTKNYVPGNSYTMSTSDVTFTAQWATSAEANHYHYSYKDATRYNGSAYKDPTGAAATSDGETHTLTDGDLCTSLGGITSVSFASAKYDGKKDDLSYMSSYLKIETGTPKVTITIAEGYYGTLKIKAGGYSGNPTISVSNSTKLSGIVGGVATTEDNFNELVYSLTSGAHDITCSSKNMYISEMDLVTFNSVSSTVGANGYTTFACSYPLDLTDANRPEGLKAYKATRDGANLTFEKLNQTVPAGTGLLLLGETKGGTYNIPVAASGTAVENNALVGVTSPVAKQSVENTTYYFVMKKATNENDPLKFAPITTTKEVTIPAGKAYIEVPNSAFTGARELAISFSDGETTGINGIEEVAPVTKTRKVVKNGRLVIETAKGEFTIDGARIK